MSNVKYRFEDGKLFKFDASRNAYVFVFSSEQAKTLEAAIEAYEAKESD